jgi:hypothetical protein
MRDAFRRALATFLTLACGTAPAARIDAVRVFKGVKGLLSPQRFREIRSVYAASDGIIWAVGIDWGYGSPGEGRDPEWFARRFNNVGRALGTEITLFPLLYPTGAGSVVPVGIAPDGSLVADVTYNNPEGRQFLAKVSPTGTLVSTGILPPHQEPCVDRDGIAHVVARGPYIQVNTTAPGLPVARPTEKLESVPDYLCWGGQLAFLSDEHGRLVVATRMMGRDGPRFRLCRVDTKTLALLDSGSLNVYQDTFRTFLGPHFPIPRPILVPAESSGYWLFMPTDATLPAATMYVYRISHDLKVVYPHAEFVSGQRPFSEVPKDAAIIVQSGSTSGDWHEDGAWLANTKLKLEFIAFGRDGQVCTQTLEDSVASRVTK